MHQYLHKKTTCLPRLSISALLDLLIQLVSSLSSQDDNLDDISSESTSSQFTMKYFFKTLKIFRNVTGLRDMVKLIHKYYK